MFTILLIMFWFVIASTWRMVQEAMYMLVSLDLNKGLVDGFVGKIISFQVLGTVNVFIDNKVAINQIQPLYYSIVIRYNIGVSDLVFPIKLFYNRFRISFNVKPIAFDIVVNKVLQSRF